MATNKKKHGADGSVTMMDCRGLEGNPLNRRFATAGPEWEEFVESVRRHGVMVPLVVRPKDDFHEVLAGHRRLAAAKTLRLAEVPVLVRTMEDDEALVFLANENLQREDLDPVEAGRLLRAMEQECGWGAEELARRVCRSVEWVRTRQLLLDLGDEVCEAVRTRDADRHLPMGSVEAILRVPEEMRVEAVQMVLHPAFDVRPLRPVQAAEYLEDYLVKPARDKAAWEAGREALAKEWKTRLRKGMPKALHEYLTVMAPAWDEIELRRRGKTHQAEEHVLLGRCAPDAPRGLTWGMLAARHGVPVWVVTKFCSAEHTEALVAADAVELGEQALADHGGVTWLLTGGKAARDGRVEKAEKDLDDPGHDAAEEKPETVFEQRMGWYGVIDLGRVKSVAMWACGATGEKADPMDAPEWVPGWVRKLAVEGYWTEIDEAMAWVMELRKAAEDKADEMRG